MVDLWADSAAGGAEECGAGFAQNARSSAKVIGAGGANGRHWKPRGERSGSDPAKAGAGGEAAGVGAEVASVTGGGSGGGRGYGGAHQKPVDPAGTQESARTWPLASLVMEEGDCSDCDEAAGG